jgi:hypothetical protein
MKSQSRIGVLVVLAAAVLLATGCSVANPFAPSNAAAKTSAEQLALKWSQCMRQHGVNVSDPTGNGAIRIQSSAPPGSARSDGPISGTATTGGGPAGDPTFQAAFNACKQYQPSGRQSSGPPSQQQLDAATRFAQCMRDHGIPMQDPRAQGNGGIMIGGGGAVDPNSDQFKQAQQACQHFMDQAKPQS